MSVVAKRWRMRLRGPGLRGRTALAMVVAVALACAVLTVVTTAWAAANYREAQTQRVGDVVRRDAQHLYRALEVDPKATTVEELSAAGWLDSGTETVGDEIVIPLDAQDEEIDPARALQVGFFSGFMEPVSERAPECLIPARRPGHIATGTTVWWTEVCGDHLMAYALIQPGTDEEPGKPWLLVRALYLPSEEDSNPVPALRGTLIWISVAVVAALSLVSRRVARGVIAPVTEAGAMARAVADGDLTVRIPIHGYDEVAAMSRAVNTMANRLTAQIEELERANETQRRFVSDVAHELRTPTTALLASAEALENPGTREAAAVMVAPQLLRLAGLTEDLLEINRMDAGRAEVVASTIDLVDLISKLSTDIPASATYLGPSELWLSTDPVRVQAILRNLMANAIQHGELPITVTLAQEGARVVVDIHDDGPGVPPEIRERVFDRFVRGDASRHGRSSGLGLAIATENAQLLGGTLTLEEGGTTFRLTLPANPDATIDDTQEAER